MPYIFVLGCILDIFYQFLPRLLDVLCNFAADKEKKSIVYANKTWQLYVEQSLGFCVNHRRLKGPRERGNRCTAAARPEGGERSDRGEPEKLIAYNTYQVKNYDNYELRGFSEPDKRKYREEHWEEDLQTAFDAGKRMAEKVIRG